MHHLQPHTGSVSLHEKSLSILVQKSKQVTQDTHEMLYDCREDIDTSLHPSHFLSLYDGDILLGELQYGYFAPNGHQPYYYIANLTNFSDKKGVGKRLMREFLSTHSRVFLDDNAHIGESRVSGYYEQFGLQSLDDTSMWYTGFSRDEANNIPLLYTRSLVGEMRRDLIQ